MTRKLLVSLACCLVMVFVMASFVSAKSPKGPGGPGEPADNVIHGCYKKVNGQLRIVKDPGQCRPSELPILWNQIGPQGPEGPPGPPGIGNIQIARQEGSAPLGGDTGTEVLSLIVPAGAYAISAKVSVANSDPDVQPADCTLSTGDTSTVELAGGADDIEQVISLLDADTFASDTTITLTCFTKNGTAVNGVLAAIEVGSVIE